MGSSVLTREKAVCMEVNGPVRSRERDMDPSGIEKGDSGSINTT